MNPEPASLDSSKGKNFFCQLLIPFVNIHNSELIRTLVAFIGLCLIMCSYYIMKPVRSALILGDLGPDYLPYVYLSQGIFTLFATFIYNNLSIRFSKLVLVRLTYFTILAIFLGFWGALSYLENFKNIQAISRVEKSRSVDKKSGSRGNKQQAIDGEHKKGLTKAEIIEAQAEKLVLSTFITKVLSFTFNIFVSTYILFVMAIFWSTNHDIFNTEEACRLFGMILLGAQVGQFFGGKITVLFAAELGTLNLILISASILFLAFICAEILHSNYNPVKKSSPPKKETPKKSKFSEMFEDFKTVFFERHFSWIAILVIFASMSNTILDFQYNNLVSQTFSSNKDQITEHIGNFWKYNAQLNILILLFLSSRVVRYLGPAIILLFLPFLHLISNLKLALGSMLAGVMPFAIATMTFNYTLYNMGKEVLYVPVEQNLRYRMKAFIGAFCFRFGDGLAAVSMIFFTKFFAGRAYTYSRILFLVILVFWIPVILKANSSFKTFKTEAETEI
ncbi:NTP/NDP exchange transporter [Candidatus Riflebacteria bacterium]